MECTEKMKETKKVQREKEINDIIRRKLGKWSYVTIYVLITEDYDIFGCKDV